MRTVLSCVLLVAFSGPLGADDKKDEKIDPVKLVGKWEWQEKKKIDNTIEFTKGGRAISVYKDGDLELKLEGAYKLEDEKLTIEYETESRKAKATFTIKKLTDTKMVAIPEGGGEITLIRLKDK